MLRSEEACYLLGEVRLRRKVVEMEDGVCGDHLGSGCVMLRRGACREVNLNSVKKKRKEERVRERKMSWNFCLVVL